MLNSKVTQLVTQPNFNEVVGLWTICENTIQGSE
jgi:hypothetical protein